MLNSRICVVCLHEFTPKHNLQVCCSAECKKRRRSEQRAERKNESVRCAVCGKEFIPTIKKQKYCSDKCRRKYLNRKYFLSITNKLYSGKKSEALIEPRKCHDCGEPTYNYRCNRCREIWCRKHCVPMYGFDEYEEL